MTVEAFVIHLKRAEGRRAQVERIMAACPVPARIIDAVDGSALGSDVLSQAYSADPLFRPPYPFAINAGEIGCFLSHRRTWHRIIDAKLQAALILEDDVEIDQAVFQTAYDLALQNIDRCHYIQFQVRPIAGPASTLEQDGDVRLVKPTVIPLRTSAQLVSARAAEQLMAITERFDRPIDGVLQLTWETGLPICCVDPSGVQDRTSQTGGSTISSRKRLGPIKWLDKQIQRWRYRRAIATMSRSNPPDTAA